MRLIYTCLPFLLRLCLCNNLDLYPDIEHAPFLYGVASGDPLIDAVLIWTKVDSLIDVAIEWRMWEDRESFNNTNDSNHSSGSSFSPLRNGTVVTTEQSDWTINVDVKGLSAATNYFYQFLLVGSNQSSVIGRTKTLPEKEAVNPVTIAVASCSSIWSGYFSAYSDIAENSKIDLVVHLGDYIYPDMAGSGLECIRIPFGLCDAKSYFAADKHFDACPVAQPPGEEFFHSAKLNCTASETEPNYLQRFRWTHTLYLLDPNLRKARQNKPWVTVYDNHDQGDESGRLTDSLQAFFEYVPHRHTVTPGGYVQSWRYFPMGKNLDFIVLDLRTWALNTSDFVGEEQWEWLAQVLNGSGSNTTASWRMIGTQVQFSPFALNDVHVVVDKVMVGLFMSVLTLTTLCGCTLCQCRTIPRASSVEFLSLNGTYTARSRAKRYVCDPKCGRCERCCCLLTPQLCEKCKCCVSTYDGDKKGCSNRCCGGKCVNVCCPPCRGCFVCGIVVVVLIIAIWIAAAALLGATFGEHLSYLVTNDRTWDGNPLSRARMFNLLSKQHKWDNNLWVAGDMHYTVVSDIFQFDDTQKSTLLDYDRSDFAGKRFGVEFLPASVSRGNLDEKVWDYTGWQTHTGLNVLMSSFLDRAIATINPQYRYFDGSRHGYGLFTFSPNSATAEIRYFNILDAGQPMEVGYSTVLTQPL